jgi:predicted amidohydrolase YtcJ
VPTEPSALVGSMLLRQVRLVPVGQPSGSPEPIPFGTVDILIRDGVVEELGPRLHRTPGLEVVDTDGRFLIPGLWDAHVHLGSWTIARHRLDLRGTTSPREAADRVAARLAELATSGARPDALVGFGHRSATWAQTPTVAVLDEAAPDVPVALISGDGHTGWVNSALLRHFQLASREGPLEENDWFAIHDAVADLAGLRVDDEGYRRGIDHAARRGLVGIVDMQDAANTVDWPERVSRGLSGLRVVAATYPRLLDRLLATGLRSGALLAGSAGLVSVGPVKVISDGALSSRTALCFDPYDGTPGAPAYGLANLSAADLTDLARQAHGNGLELAVHAIGDRALSAALDSFGSVGAAGSIEHAQLARHEDIIRMAAQGLRASVQPAHLLDDRDTADRVWAGRTGRSFAFASMLRSGVRLAFGSDAPVAPLDPWLAMAAAVHRSGDDRPGWHMEQALTPQEALAASTNGEATPRVGTTADFALLDHDPYPSAPSSADQAAALRRMAVAGTIVAGRFSFRDW